MEKLLQACAEFVKHKCENIEQKENMPEHLQFVLKEPISVLRQNSPTAVAKNLTLQLLFIEEADRIFKNLPNNIKQEICAISY